MSEEKLRIVVLSDLNWSSWLKTITASELEDFNLGKLNIDRYERIKRYYDIIIKEEADLVLFAGDVTGDGFCGRGFHLAFVLLLKLLDEKNIESVFISGNHDVSPYYDYLLEHVKDFKYTQDTSGKLTTVRGLKILGVSYDTSKSKRALKSLIRSNTEPVDIVLAHSTIKRRIRHFDFKTQYIFTGHYDRKLFMHRQIAYVSLDNDSDEVSYAVLQKTKLSGDNIQIKIRRDATTTFSFKERVSDLLANNRNSILCVNDKPSFDLIKLENASDLPLGIYDLTLNQIHGLPITASYKISESMIEDYLGNVID